MSIDFPNNPAHNDTFISPFSGAMYQYDRPRDSWFYLVKKQEEADFSKVSIGENPPKLPDPGDLWIDWNYYMHTFDGRQWVGITNEGENTKVLMSSDPPADAKPGFLWFNTETSDLNVFYKDSDSYQWVAVTSLQGTISLTPMEINLELNTLSQKLSALQNQIEELKEDGRGDSFIQIN